MMPLVGTWTTQSLEMPGRYMGGAAAGNKSFICRWIQLANVTTDPFLLVVDILHASNNSWSSSSLTDRPVGGATF